MDDVTTTTPASPAEEDQGLDGIFIGALVCIACGAVLLIAGFIRLIVWIVRTRREKRLEKRKIRHLEHMRYLEDYSIKAGDSPNDVIVQNNNTTPDGDSVFKWDAGLVNAGYIGEDTLNRHSPKEPKLTAHMNGSSSHIRHTSTGSQPNSRPVSRSSYTSGLQDGAAALAADSRASVSGANPRGVNGDRLADVPV